MKKLLKFVIISLCVIGVAVGCGNTAKVVNNSDLEVFGSSMSTAFDFEATFEQFDSVRVADNLPKIDKWYVSSYTDYETGKVFKRYVYSVQLNKGVAKYTFLIDEESPYPFKKIISK